MKKKYFDQDNEEFLNFVSHGIALIISFIGLFFLIEKFYYCKFLNPLLSFLWIDY